MISQADRLRGGPLAETEIRVPPSSNEDKVLSRLNQNFRLSKAQQILRLLKDQDELNQRFRDCALLDDDDDEGTNHAGRQRKGDPDQWSLEEEQSEAGDSDSSEHEAERRAARQVALRKHRNSVDPGRCKTSMGFYNQAEVTEIPYDTDSDNVPGLDSACSTPRGVSSGALSARQPAPQGLYGVPAAGKSFTNSRLRAYHLQIGDSDVIVNDQRMPEECVVQSARSSRPKTSLVSHASMRNRYYRQQPHPENHHRSSKSNHHHNNNNHHHHHSQQHHNIQPRGVGDTRQAIISRLDPHHPMAVRPFCESQALHDAMPIPGIQQSSSQPSTPRGGVRGQGNAVPMFNHTEVTLFDMAPGKDSSSRSSSRRAAGMGSSGTGTPRSSTYNDHQRVTPANRPLLSVDSSPLQIGELSPRPRPQAEDSRRLRSSRVKKKVGEIPRGAVSTSMHMISDRSHPAMTMMKLPPLEKSGSGRDLVCVGKD